MLEAPTITAASSMRGDRGHPRQGASRLLAHKGYDADQLRRRLTAQGAEAVIASTPRGVLPSGTTHRLRDRNRVERMWCRLKDFQLVTTRYDKLAGSYLSVVLLVATCAYWLY
jgi:transposase